LGRKKGDFSSHKVGRGGGQNPLPEGGLLSREKTEGLGGKVASKPRGFAGLQGEDISLILKKEGSLARAIISEKRGREGIARAELAKRKKKRVGGLSTVQSRALSR